MRYTDYIFDLYGTLVDIHTDENDLVWEKTAFYFGFHGAIYSPQELKSAFRKQMQQMEAGAGQSYECFPDIPVELVFAYLFRDKGITDNVDNLAFHAAQLFRIASLDYIQLYPKAKETLQALRDKGCRVWLLSNAQRAFTEYELRYLGLLDCFDGIYISSDYRFRKPDLRFFDALILEQGLEPDKCIMIGNDRMTDIAGAKASGLSTLYMHTELTPCDQEKADPTLHPGVAGGCCHMETEGWDPELLQKLPDILH